MSEQAKIDLSAQLLAAVALLSILKLGLLPALLAGLTIYELAHYGARRLKGLGATHRVRKALTLTLASTVLAIIIAIGVVKLRSLLTDSPDSLAVLLQKMAEIVATARNHLPEWTWNYLPSDTAEVQVRLSAWLREHAGQLKLIGQHLWKSLAYLVIGMIIGGVIAFSRTIPNSDMRPLTQALTTRALLLRGAFRRVVLAQGKISTLNTTLTAIYLAIILPALGVHLPLTKTMIILTFVVGMVPILGNLVSNFVIVVVSLSASPAVAVSSLLFLILIHKLEYFFNAHFIGERVHAQVWELLLAMLVMETIFGVPGLIAAPIYYAYLKDELVVRKLI